MSDRVITGKTKLCGVIGDPIEHTMSPAMHNAAFIKLGVDYVYVPFRVRQEELGKAIAGMKALGIRGLNVTIPHKVAIIPFLDELDPMAERTGAGPLRPGGLRPHSQTTHSRRAHPWLSEHAPQSVTEIPRRLPRFDGHPRR